MRKLIASCSAVLIVMAVLGACGGDSDDSSNPSDTNPSQTTTADGNGDGNGGGDDDDFAQLVEDASKERFKITYTTGSDGDEQFFAQDGQGTSVYGSADGESLFFTSDDGSIGCNTDSGGEVTCTQLPGGSSISPFLTLFQSGLAAIETLGGVYGDVSSRTIAGRDARCLTVSVGASATYCIDSETGVLLEISGEDASGDETVTFRVTKFEEPSDSDFEPPATPQTIPSISLPDGVTIPSIPGADQ